jgi:Tol biopolymer transport system component
VYARSLSADGTRLVRQYDRSQDPRLEVVNLLTGSTNRLGGHRGFCPQISPDNTTVAVIARWTDRLVFLDARTGRRLPGGHGPFGDGEECPVISWSPDGSRLTFGDLTETLVLDRRGREVGRLPGLSAVNASMSWSPDGRSILMYVQPSGRFVVHELDSGAESVLATPRDALRPLGWWGDRVVWLVGPAGGAQRLVSTDRTGHDPRPWMQLEVGDRAVETVQWSRDLTGGGT